jgi:hypothetical protein
LERTAGIERNRTLRLQNVRKGISALNAREAPGCPRRLARCVAMWCDAQRRVVERCNAPGDEPRRAALPTVVSISPTHPIDPTHMAGRGATSRQCCCRSRHLFRSRRKKPRLLEREVTKPATAGFGADDDDACAWCRRATVPVKSVICLGESSGRPGCQKTPLSS